ncbi:MAG: acylphosphatase [Synergistaceae bacterium]|nr:acylphosphatase [Synergistaceae bacterium]
MVERKNLCRRHAVVSGRVQGVGFRWFAKSRADELGLSGWVRNLPDGAVELVFQGEACLVDEMEDWCHLGSPQAYVRNVEITEEFPLDGERGFEIR